MRARNSLTIRYVPAPVPGPVFYPAGVWSALSTYERTSSACPFVLLDTGNPDTDLYYYLAKPVKIAGNAGNKTPAADYAQNGANATWKPIENIGHVFARLLIASLGLLGKSVFYGEYMFSQYGKDGSTDISTEGRYGVPTDAGGTFNPNFLVNFLTGYLRCNNVELTGVINAVSGIFKNIRVSNSVLKDVRINGTVSQPWARSGIYVNVGPGERVTYDNIASGETGGWDDGSVSHMLTWTLADSGRTVRLANWKYDGETFDGSVSVKAPAGKYFFEDGIAKAAIEFSREVVEMIGYGDSSSFYGWIVLNRVNLMGTRSYGRKLNLLAQGIVTGTTSGASVSCKTFDGSKLSVGRVETGVYRVGLPAAWGLVPGGYIVMLTGHGMVDGSGSSPVKATLGETAATHFLVHCSDDATRNDGSFMFQVSNLNDWIY